MIIANPIYDTVFKYLMEDLGIAKDLLAMILDVEITELSVQPQETTAQAVLQDRPPVSIYRLDFVAIIKDKNGKHKKVLIELQKSKRSTNILRFRRYLAENYQKEDNVVVNNREVSQTLELVTLYFLGFELDDVGTSIMKVKNCYVDITTGHHLLNEPADKFVRLLNHESYMVQIPKLKPNDQSRVENVLTVFSQKFVIPYDDRKLNYDETLSNDPLTERILNRLTRAIADDDLRRKMNFEDEIERGYNMELQEIEAKLELQLEEKIEERYAEKVKQNEEKLEQIKQELAQKDKQIKQELEQKDKQTEQELEQKDKQIEDLLKQIALMNKGKEL